MKDVPRTPAALSSSSSSSSSSPSYARRLARLRRAVGEWLDHPGDECSRSRALDVARGVLVGGKVTGYREDSGMLVPVASFLERPRDPRPSTVADLRERFRGPFRFLKAQARARSA